MRHANDFRRAVDGILSEFHGLSVLGHLDRGAISRIRGTWQSRPPWESVELIPIVAPHIGNLDESQVRILYLVTMLFGINPNINPADGDLGWSFHRRVGPGVTESMERSFLSVFDCRGIDTLWPKLAEIMNFMTKGGGGTPINWYKLCYDLAEWTTRSNHIPRKWSESYYLAKKRSQWARKSKREAD